jgi:hypothetical protein
MKRRDFLSGSLAVGAAAAPAIASTIEYRVWVPSDEIRHIERVMLTIADRLFPQMGRRRPRWSAFPASNYYTCVAIFLDLVPLPPYSRPIEFLGKVIPLDLDFTKGASDEDLAECIVKMAGNRRWKPHGLYDVARFEFTEFDRQAMLALEKSCTTTG